MTIPVERTNAVISTQKFLLELLDPKKTPRVPRSVRRQALHLLRHYPTEFDMNMIAEHSAKNTTFYDLNQVEVEE